MQQLQHQQVWASALLSWSKTERDRAYTLQVVQQPLRARTCGFGSKDRRPLAPAAIAKMTVRNREDNSIVDPDENEIAFFIAMAELWSVDGSDNCTMVADPSSLPSRSPIQRAQPYPHAKKPRKSTSGHSLSDAGNDYSKPPSAVYLSAPPASSSPYPSAAMSYDLLAHPNYSNPQDPFATSLFISPRLDHIPFHPADSYASQYPSQEFTEPWSQLWDQNQVEPQPHYNPFEQSHHTMTHFGGPPVASTIMSPPNNYSSHFKSSPSPPLLHASVMLPSQEQYNLADSSSGSEPSTRMSSSENLKSGPYSYSSKHISSPRSERDRPQEVHNLLGPIHTNAARLVDDHGEPGIFFVFQDLSIRTDGTFRLKIKLLTVANIGASEVSQQETPILAETWTEPFMVYAPKDFPGVPVATPLSQTFARQGQKLIHRNKPGPNGSSIRPRDNTSHLIGHANDDYYEDD